MPDDLNQPVFQGQKFKPSARVWNMILDAVRWVMEEDLRRGRRDPPMTYKYFRITAAEVMSVVSEGDLAMWRYTGDEVLPTKIYEEDPFADRYKIRVAGLVDQYLYNDAEERDPNYSAEQFTIDGDNIAYGNGVIGIELPDAMRVTHIPVGRVVRAWYTPVDGGAEWRFDSPNGITGPCEEPAS